MVKESVKDMKFFTRYHDWRGHLVTGAEMLSYDDCCEFLLCLPSYPFPKGK